MTKFSTEIEIDAPAQKVWETLADIGNIYKWSPGVKFSKVTNEVRGMGGSRHCDLPGNRFLEEAVVEYEKGKALTMRVMESNLPFQRADIHFTLKEDGNHTHVTVQPEYEIKYGIIGKVMDLVMLRPSYRKGMRGLLKGLKKHVEAS